MSEAPASQTFLDHSVRLAQVANPQSEIVHFSADQALPLDCGEKLGPFSIAYQTYGTLNADKSNLVLVCHALTGDQHVVVRSSAASALGKFQHPADVELLKRRVLGTRSMSVDALLAYPANMVAGAIRELAAVKSSSVQMNLAFCLGDWRHPDAPKILRQVVARGLWVKETMAAAGITRAATTMVAAAVAQAQQASPVAEPRMVATVFNQA